MKTKTVMQNSICGDIEDYEKNCHLFCPSISKRKNIGGKSYYVRRYFKGGKDFGKTMEILAAKQTHKNSR